MANGHHYNYTNLEESDSNLYLLRNCGIVGKRKIYENYLDIII